MRYVHVMLTGVVTALITAAIPLGWPAQAQATGFTRHAPNGFFTGPQLALAQAIRDGDLGRVRQLAPKTDLNTPGAKHTTLLAFAVQEIVPVKNEASSPRYRIVSALLAHGADPKARLDNGQSIAEIALRADTPNLLRVLLDGGLDPNWRYNGDTPMIFEVAENRFLPQLALLLEHQADVNARDSLGKTALFQATLLQQWDTVDYLLAHGADPTLASELGVTYGWVLQNELQHHIAPGSPASVRIEQIRRKIVADGAPWPPLDPATQRAAMRARGEKVVTPAGQAQ
ncbi:ankyrin repeat domain-containing protein [Burkholderia sp. Ac-20379]|uniref:ankyrin repeat domain-containing protein n=1 Tax=Burkholderia sp. Ac-20379 TaxID=2703900 RepID=UPI00197E37A9|nr:ankyrin repeat domain-containing protein [Burkholderia sp. Ac-20379]MBN3725675.1 ankyrin repeat domain-containing protein [Burkholderia sp. Ac-20379]